jgi:hypothetical protein
MNFHEKEAGTAISYDFSHENSWKRGRNGHFVRFFSWKFVKKRPKRPFRTTFLINFHEKEAGTAVSYDFSHKFSWKEAGTVITRPFCMIFLMKIHTKIEQIKTGFRFKPVWIKPVCGLNRF